MLATSAAAAAKDTWSSIKLVRLPRPSSLYHDKQRKGKAEGEMPKGDEEGVDTIATKVSAVTRTHPSELPNVKRKLEWELTPQPEAPRANHQQPTLAESPCQDLPQPRPTIVRDEEELRQRLAAAQQQRQEADEQVRFWQKELEIAEEEKEKKLLKEKEKERKEKEEPQAREKEAAEAQENQAVEAREREKRARTNQEKAAVVEAPQGEQRRRKGAKKRARSRRR